MIYTVFYKQPFLLMCTILKDNTIFDLCVFIYLIPGKGVLKIWNHRFSLYTSVLILSDIILKMISVYRPRSYPYFFLTVDVHSVVSSKGSSVVNPGRTIYSCLIVHSFRSPILSDTFPNPVLFSSLYVFQVYTNLPISFITFVFRISFPLYLSCFSVLYLG